MLQVKFAIRILKEAMEEYTCVFNTILIEFGKFYIYRQTQSCISIC